MRIEPIKVTHNDQRDGAKKYKIQSVVNLIRIFFRECKKIIYSKFV